MATGPTQNYDDPSLVGWRPRPAVAILVRAGLAALPLAVAVGFGLLAVRYLPPGRVGLHPWAWLVVEVACAAGLLLLVSRATRRLLPLAALLRLTLVLPDQVPSRFSVARRRHSPDVLRRAVAEPAAAPDPSHTTEARLLLDLVGALAAHDRPTFRHSERVQAYSALIADEMGLHARDVARLGWAALLHDVGKLAVPAEVLNKTSRPDEAEWTVLAGHAAHGAVVAGHLRPWLGPWASAIDQHHERWDGGGYPYGLAGREIHLGARIVAVADAFDVITSARAYKRPLAPDTARAELARCAGTQFDPDVVRAFLAVGLGSLRAVVGPVSLASGLPGLLPALQGTTAVTGRLAGLAPGAPSVAAATAMGMAGVVGVGLATSTPWLPPPAAPPSVTVESVTETPAPSSRGGGAAAEPVDGAAPDPAPVQPAPDPDAVTDPRTAGGAADAPPPAEPAPPAGPQEGTGSPGVPDAAAEGGATDAPADAAPDDTDGTTPPPRPPRPPRPTLPDTADDAARDAVNRE